MEDKNKPYDYTSAGFDAFLNRSVDNVPQANLDAPGPSVNQVRFDTTQVSGLLGDSIQLGGVRITKKGILMGDNGIDTLLIGDEDAS